MRVSIIRHPIDFLVVFDCTFTVTFFEDKNVGSQRENQVVVLSELSHGGALSSWDDKGGNAVKLGWLPYLHAFNS